MSSYGSYSRDFQQTATWAVAGVCAVIIIISVVLEKGLHKIGAWLTARHKKGLYEAVEIIKSELMILGFISLILVFTQYYIADICIPRHVAYTMLPCPRPRTTPAGNGRRLLSYERRFLAGGSGGRNCRPGTVSLISVDALHEIHVLIFFIAVLHLVYSAVTMALGRLKIRGWKKWEEETATHNYEFSNDPSRFRLTHETSFVKSHTSLWTRVPVLFYIGCFFRQFFKSVNKSDYLTLRNGFIAVHLAPGSKFNFQKYIKRSLEDDFKVVVGVSPILWASLVIFLLLNVNGWQALFWASLLPVVIIFAVGTKLQAILTRMALDIIERHAVVQGIPLVQGSDKYFWFGRPHLMLQLIHFVLFLNAFQLTYFLWVWYQFGLRSCIHDHLELVLIKMVLGIFVLLFCSYITLPLYALVAQMGSHMKKSIFDEHTSKALMNWQRAAKKNKGQGGKSPARNLGGASPSPSSSPFHRYQSTGHSVQASGYDDASDLEDPSTHPPVTRSLIVRSNPGGMDNNGSHDVEHETRNEDDFSFAKSADSAQSSQK